MVKEIFILWKMYQFFLDVAVPLSWSTFISLVKIVLKLVLT